MSKNGAPKLLINKPKKGAQVRKSQGNFVKDFTPERVATPPPPSLATPPLAPVKESFFRRYKYLWPLLLTVNLGYGAYVYQRFKKQNTSVEEEDVAAAHAVAEKSSPSTAVSAPPVSTQTSAIAGQTALTSAATAPDNPHTAVPEERQRELFKWILEEKKENQTKRC